MFGSNDGCFIPDVFHATASASLFFASNHEMLIIIISMPIVVINNRANPNQPSTIADAPTPLLTLPFPKSCVMVLAATEAVCCHSTVTSIKTVATKQSARQTWLRARDGTRLNCSIPCVSSACQPGKVSKRRRAKNASIRATILQITPVSGNVRKERKGAKCRMETHVRYGNTTASLNVFATHIRFSGS